MIEASEGNIDLFVSISFAVRIIQALGNTAVGTAIFALATMLFPDNPASIMVILNCHWNWNFTDVFLWPRKYIFLKQWSYYLRCQDSCLPFLDEANSINCNDMEVCIICNYSFEKYLFSLQGSLESVIGIGLMAGPALAGALFDVCANKYFFWKI